MFQRFMAPVVTIAVEGLGDEVPVRRLTAAQRLEVARRSQEAGGDPAKLVELQAWLIASTVLGRVPGEDEDARSLFATPEAATALDCVVFDALTEAILDVNRLRAGQVTDLGKDSGRTTADGSPTASPSPSVNGTLTPCLTG